MAQQAILAPLTVEKIMQDPRWMGVSPSNMRWSIDGTQLLFDWNKEDLPYSQIYAYTIKTGELKQLNETEKAELLPRFGVFNTAKTKYLYQKNGDLSLFDLKTKKNIELTATQVNEKNPYFSPDESKVIFAEGDNIFSIDLKTGMRKQYTNFSDSKMRAKAKLSEQDAWLERQQMDLFEVLKSREDVKTKQNTYRNNKDTPSIKELPINGKSLTDVVLTADERYIYYALVETAQEGSTNVPQWITKNGYTQEQRARAKVGGPQDDYSCFIYSIETDTLMQIDFSNLPGITDAPAYYSIYNRSADGERRKVIVNYPYINAVGSKMVLDIRAQDNKDRWLAAVDLNTGKLSCLDQQHDDAWIGGPGIGEWEFGGNLGWMKDNTTFWYQSEKTGYSHIYTIDVNTGIKKQITKGEYEIHEAQLSSDGKSWYVLANKTHPGDRHFYKVQAQSLEMTALTSGSGYHDATLSPDEQWIAVRYSYKNKPWELYIVENKKQAVAKQITVSTSELFNSYAWRQPEVVTFTARDSASVYARLYTPTAETKNGAAVIFVHGAGYLQNAHNYWSNYYREYMFHNLLVDKGYTVLDIDYRGSEGYGRNWRTGIYRFMGNKDLSDNLDGAQYLVQTQGIDKNRIGIYGGSYGGFITLMALFTSPGTFNSGAALRSVTDWAHYNHGYTSNILNTPVLDSIAFAQSSPIYHASGLQDNLLMCHGMVDDNVQFQDIVRLSQRLIELQKTNWELAVYPVERHGFVEPSSWIDEYSRILKLFETGLKP